MTVLTQHLWATHAGVRIHAIEWAPVADGDGVAVVVLPGLLANAELVTDDGLAAAAGRLAGRRRRLVAVDRRGMGRSGAPDRGYGFVEFAEDVHAIADSAGLLRYVLFGHSLGVPIAITHALRWQDRIAGLVLGSQWPGCERLDEGEPLLKWAATRSPLATSEEIVTELAGVTGLSRPVLKRTWERYVRRTEAGFEYLFAPGSVPRLIAESRHTDLSDQLQQLSMPVLVVIGSEDSQRRLASLDRYRASLPNATVAVLKGGDHGLRVDGDRKPFYEVLGSFLARIDESEMHARAPRASSRILPG